MISDSLSFPENLASITSSLATLMLVILTGWYTLETRRLVAIESQSRKKERVEKWYREVLSEARLLQRTWDNIAKPTNLKNKGYLADEEVLEGMSERVDSLLEKYGSCPGDVPDDIRKLVDETFTEWKYVSSGGIKYLPSDHNAKESLDKLIERIEEESEDF